MRSRSVLLFTALTALTLFLFLLDLAVGAVPVPPGDVWAALTGGDCPPAMTKMFRRISMVRCCRIRLNEIYECYIEQTDVRESVDLYLRSEFT